jgi:ribonuclease BN (tRNA processing enzyme)
MHSDHINGISKLVVMLTKLKKHDFKIILPNFVKKVEISEAVALAYLVQNNVKLDDFVYNPIVYAFSLQNISEEQTKQLSQAYENKEKNKIKNSIVDAQYEINDLKNQLQVLNISDKDKKKISKKIGKYETKLSSLLFQQKRAEEK